jgi:UDP-N-acetylglucosamine--N-acetylmuramyl-(pentapeptide) pyrophosphoryl-undecaprenol N-acetylglucosamine transferase
LANKICSLFADHIIVTFEESLKYFPAHKVNHLGYPLREEIFEQKENSLVIGGSDLSAINRPILFLTGGGNGSKLLNDHLLGILNNIKDHFFIVHQCGKNFESELKKNETENYKVFGFVGREMIELMKRADVIISRAGAGTVVELIALGKPSIFIPLKHAQKNEQFHNAMEANHKIGSIVIEEVNLSEEHLLDAIDKIAKMEKKNGAQKNPIKEISDLILS